MYALIDSNNFFVSCERLFRPDLEGKPVVVLSSNDGCAISRSNEAKALGIPMGAPIFKYRELFRRHGVIAFSANFELYGDISGRISSLLTSSTPRIEIYSVDEAFLDLNELSIADYAAWGRAVRATVLRHIGIPVSVGLGPTKTLCKIAADRAKKQPELAGAQHLDPRSATRSHETALALTQTPIQDIWGVGWRLTPKLRTEGVLTAADLAAMRPQYAQKLMGIHGRHMVYELNGTSCLPLQLRSKPQHMIARGRQFGADTSDFGTIEAAITTLASRAAAELRRENQLVTRAAIVLRTNRFKPGYAQTSENVRFYTPTADTGLLCSQLVRAMSRTFNPHWLYHRAEVVFYDLVPADSLQIDLFGAANLLLDTRSRSRMQAVDAITAKHGQTALRYAAETLSTNWRPRSNMLSPRYTSAWAELPEAAVSGTINGGINLFG
jgi:DNA polymerase V